jgi:hypothetical protein
VLSSGGKGFPAQRLTAATQHLDVVECHQFVHRTYSSEREKELSEDKAKAIVIQGKVCEIEYSAHIANKSWLRKPAG